MRNWAFLILVGLLSSGAAVAQDVVLLQNVAPYGNPFHPTSELEAQSLDYAIVSASTFATVNPHQFRILMISSCQPDAVYNAWNARLDDIETFVSLGGFVARTA